MHVRTRDCAHHARRACVEAHTPAPSVFSISSYATDVSARTHTANGPCFLTHIIRDTHARTHIHTHSLLNYATNWGARQLALVHLLSESVSIA